MKIRFMIPGPCVAKPRPRFSSKTGRVYTASKGHKYEKLVKESYGDNPCFEDQFISVKITFKMAIPKSYSKKKREQALNREIFPTRADIDNYIKSIFDGLNGVCWEDDRYIYSITAEKIFAEESETIVKIKN